MSGDERRNVLMVCDSLGGGGAERQLALLAASLDGPWRATVFSFGGGVYADRLRNLGVPLVLAPRRFRFDPSPALALWRTMDELRPAVVHSWGHMGCFAADVHCRRRRIAHVAGVVRRGAVFSVRGWLPRAASRLGDLVLGNSRAGLEAFGVPPSRGRVLHNGFDPARLARAALTDPPDGPFHVVMAATMDDRKDFASFVAAVRRLRDKAPGPIRASALGAGPNLAALRAAAADLVADGVLSLPGRVDEVLDHLRAAHAGVLLAAPGWGEGISNSIMEYMVAGLPVVATDSGGNPELVRPDETGYLIAPRDVDALVERLLLLMNDRSKARALGLAGRRRIETDFSVATMRANALAIYEEAIARRAGRR
ncbi:MAG: glycosyltransferase [Krumholzibacteria bacterium]|nr:glycosyltransferase [Candidatus Krumholzibacteria bacterium]